MKKLDNTLIIGIGNNTRQDDGLGWCFLDQLEQKGFNTDILMYKYQLMVEDAEIISAYETVIFVDACKTVLDKGFSIERIYAAEQVAFSTHAVPPNQILNLCETIYGGKPISHIIKLNGYSWNLEIGLSNQAQINLENCLNYFISTFPINKP